MKIPIFAIFAVLFTIWLNLRANRAANRDDEIEKAFWRREHEANATRKKSLDSLLYIHVPPEIAKITLPEDHREGQDALRMLGHLTEDNVRIVNLTGWSNTDLKLEYGAANIGALTEYDAGYTALATALQQLGQALYDLGRFGDAERVLEFAAGTSTDITATYRLLIDLYRTKRGYNTEEVRQKTEALLPIAQSLRSLSRDKIVKMIEDAL